MDDLIAALQIFMQYVEKNSYGWKYPFSVDGEILYVTCVAPEVISAEHIEKLEILGFDVIDDQFVSHRFGSS